MYFTVTDAWPVLLSTSNSILLLLLFVEQTWLHVNFFPIPSLSMVTPNDLLLVQFTIMILWRDTLYDIIL